MPGQVGDDQSHGYRITRPPPRPVSELNRAARDDRAFGPVGADEPETIADPHRALLDEPSDDDAATGDRENFVDPEPELVLCLAAHAAILPQREPRRQNNSFCTPQATALAERCSAQIGGSVRSYQGPWHSGLHGGPGWVRRASGLYAYASPRVG
jgi:hypothetical protein